MGRLDWEKAAKRDYVRQHGSVRAAPERQRLKPQDTKTGRKLAAAFKLKTAPVLREFRGLSHSEQVARRDAFCNEIDRLRATEKGRLTPYVKRFAAGIDLAAKQAKGDIKGIVKLKKERPSRPLTRGKKRAAKPSSSRGKGDRPKRFAPDLSPVELTWKREGAGIRFDWKPVPGVSNWFLSVGPKGKKPTHRVNRGSTQLAATVRKVSDGPITVALVAIGDGKPIARTTLTIP